MATAKPRLKPRVKKAPEGLRDSIASRALAAMVGSCAERIREVASDGSIRDGCLFADRYVVAGRAVEYADELLKALGYE